jgi:alkylated DNA repair protein (DNA oxidative demethylase)
MQQSLPIEPATDPRSPMDGVLVLPGFADAGAAMAHVEAIAALAPFRHMQTPGGHAMSAAMTNCGALGWVSDRQGYRYTPHDPASGRPWPPLPDDLAAIARAAAEMAGFPTFTPDACLINRYAPGARMGLHQDRDEADFSQPVVTLSLGLAGVFQITGPRRAGPGIDIRLESGDVLVMGGPARLFHHGIRPIRISGQTTGAAYRISLTFRKAGKLYTIQ